MQLLAEKAKEQPAAIAAGVPAPAEASGPALQPLAEAGQQAKGVSAAALLDPSTAWKLEKMEAQVSYASFASFALPLSSLAVHLGHFMFDFDCCFQVRLFWCIFCTGCLQYLWICMFMYA